MGNKTFDFSSKKKDFLPQNDQIWPKIGIFGQLCALLVSRLVVVARGLYLARHLITLLIFTIEVKYDMVEEKRECSEDCLATGRCMCTKCR